MLIPSDPFEVIADILLVVRGLRAAGLVTVRWPKTRGIRCQGFVNPNEFVSDEAKFKLGVRQNNSARFGIRCRATVNLRLTARTDFTFIYFQWLKLNLPGVTPLSVRSVLS